MSGEHFDTVVIGTGAGGAVVAARLTEDSSRRVLALEAGPDFPDEHITPPYFVGGGAFRGGRGAGQGIPDGLSWDFESEPLADGRTVPMAHGRLVGGSTMVNGCVAVRGRPRDFEGWVTAGASGWSWEDVVPHYVAVEARLPIMCYPADVWLPVQRLWVDACEQIGFRFAEDFNDVRAWDRVVGPWPRNRENEIRMGTLTTFVRDARQRPNFELRPDCTVDKVVVRAGRAVGVVYRDADGAAREVRADDVVVCAGALGTPAILQRSGIGPAELLRDIGVDVVADLPVGEALMDHAGITVQVGVDPPYGRLGWPHLAVASRGADYWGIPMPLDDRRNLVSFAFFLATTDWAPGSITLRSTNPLDLPRIVMPYDAIGRAGGFDGARADLLAMLASPAMRAVGAAGSDDVIDDFRGFAAATARTGAHPAGGCAIGRVVDTELAVLGIDGLTVADASVFPRHVSNNPNLTCLMVGERAAARLRSG